MPLAVALRSHSASAASGILRLRQESLGDWLLQRPQKHAAAICWTPPSFYAMVCSPSQANWRLEDGPANGWEKRNVRFACAQYKSWVREEHRFGGWCVPSWKAVGFLTLRDLSEGRERG